MMKQGTFLGVPYDWRPLTRQRLVSRVWNKDDDRLFVPRVFGWGYTINFYTLLHRWKGLLAGLALLAMILGFLAVREVLYVDQAHRTFEGYYAFRGCTQLIERTDTYGICKTNQSQTIKIVKFQGQWYLDGDLPVCYFRICL